MKEKLMQSIPTAQEIMDNYNYYVEIQCNKCGKIFAFYPTSNNCSA
jgi:hypothetical protein